jgi:hypothetical protein
MIKVTSFNKLGLLSDHGLNWLLCTLLNVRICTQVEGSKTNYLFLNKIHFTSMHDIGKLKRI